MITINFITALIINAILWEGSVGECAQITNSHKYISIDVQKSYFTIGDKKFDSMINATWAMSKFGKAKIINIDGGDNFKIYYFRKYNFSAMSLYEDNQLNAFRICYDCGKKDEYLSRRKSFIQFSLLDVLINENMNYDQIIDNPKLNQTISDTLKNYQIRITLDNSFVLMYFQSNGQIEHLDFHF